MYMIRYSGRQARRLSSEHISWEIWAHASLWNVSKHWFPHGISHCIVSGSDLETLHDSGKLLTIKCRISERVAGGWLDIRAVAVCLQNYTTLHYTCNPKPKRSRSRKKNCYIIITYKTFWCVLLPGISQAVQAHVSRKSQWLIHESVTLMRGLPRIKKTTNYEELLKLESHNWIKSHILIGQRSEVFSKHHASWFVRYRFSRAI